MGDSAVVAVVTIEIMVVVIAVAVVIFSLANQECDLRFAKALITWHSNAINEGL